MRKVQLATVAAGVVAIIVPAASGAGLHDRRSPARPAHAHAGNGKAAHKPGPGSSSYSIGLLAPWGSAAYAGGRITVTYTLSSAPGVPGSARTAVLSALSSWNSCLGGGSGCGGISPKSRFSFAAAAGAGPLVTITIKKGGGTVAGSTKLTYSGGFISAARLQISASSFGSPNTSQTVYEIALHELGHVVGLGHSNDPSDLMYPVLNGTTSFGGCEVNGFNALYSSWLGAGSPTSPSQSSVGC